MSSDAPTPDAPSLSDRYFALIDQIVDITLKGKLRSKEQIYQQLVRDVEAGTGEIFERCLATRLEETQARLNTGDELKQAKASRILRALQAIQGEWERYTKRTTVDRSRGHSSPIDFGGSTGRSIRGVARLG